MIVMSGNGTLLFCEKGSLEKIRQELKKEKKSQIICLDNDIHETLSAESIKHRNIWEYSLNESVESEVLDWFKTWADKPFSENINIKQMLDYKGISLWWFLEIGVFDSYKGINYPVPVKKLLEKLELLDVVVKAENPDEIIFLNTSNPHNFYYADLFSAMGYDIRHIRSSTVRLQHIFWTSFFPVIIRKFSGIRRIARKLASWIFLRPAKNKDEKKDKGLCAVPVVVIISLTSNWKNKRDFIFESLIHRLRKTNQVIRVDFPVFSLIGIKNIYQMSRIFYGNVLFKAAEGYDVDFKQIAASVKQMQKNYEEMKKTGVYYKSYDISGIFYKQLDFHMYYYGLENAVYFLETVLKITEHEKPASLVLIDEYNPIGRSVVTAGKLSHIRTIAMQHGAISTIRPSYVHPGNEISDTGDYHTPYYPLPDITAVFGPYYMNLLMNIGNYKADSLRVTGSVRYDTVPEKKKQLNSRDTLLKLGLDPDRKMILFTSQPIDQEEKDKIFAALEKAVSEVPDCQLVIKLHPAEMYPSGVPSQGPGGKVPVVKDIDIYEIINSCDIMLTAFSTTAMEAMILDKPVITINLTGKPDMMPYAKSGAAVGVYSYKDLSAAINSVLTDSNLRDELSRNSKEFIYQHLFRTDGKATERVAAIIEQSDDKC